MTRKKITAFKVTSKNSNQGSASGMRTRINKTTVLPLIKHSSSTMEEAKECKYSIVDENSIFSSR